MNDSLRRRYPALLLLAAGSLLAAISFWALEVTRRSSDESQPKAARSDPDYFVEDFSYTRLAPDGKAQYLVSGSKLIHYPTDDSSVVLKPTIRSYSDTRDPMTLQAKRARITKDQREVHLYENVSLERLQVKGSEPLQIESDYMLALPDQDIVKTDRQVTIRLGGSKLVGTGMVADNARRQLTLQRKVTGFYESPR